MPFDLVIYLNFRILRITLYYILALNKPVFGMENGRLWGRACTRLAPAIPQAEGLKGIFISRVLMSKKNQRNSWVVA